MAVDEAAKGMTRAARNYTTAEDFVAAVQLWTHDLNRQQLLALVAQLSCQLSNFYSADPLTAEGRATEEDLIAWLNGD
ncbi:hypothetical protein [Mycolicibacterium parafortuitum]|uniref:hypothetical protein n=1 Tax=Mycolicibacterium parafortuitum TaxID=39692 RepID=UPI00105471A9|nr:hypothetical protein [Mycolicibacterium parafortuitum]